jgi:CubicO group peptidase (beta-lactamase class C family)
MDGSKDLSASGPARITRRDFLAGASLSLASISALSLAACEANDPAARDQATGHGESNNAASRSKPAGGRSGGKDRRGIGPRLSEVDAYLQDRMREERIPGMAVAVVGGDRVVWANSYGFADSERRRLYTLDTIHNVASITKTFTATVALQLWERGLVDLDADISEYLPYRVRNPYHPDEPITTRQLLTHTSSITTDVTTPSTPYSLAYRSGDDPGPRPGQFTQQFLGVGQVNYSKDNGFWQDRKPGSLYEYNDTAWLLIADMVEEVAGKDYRRWCRDEIFEPLGMASSGFYLEDVDLSRHAVLYGYMKDGESLGAYGAWPHLYLDRAALPSDGYVSYALYASPTFPDGGLRTSVADLSRWAIAWMNGGSVKGRQVLDGATVRQALSPQTDAVPPEEQREQGFGWRRETEDDSAYKAFANVWSHSGTDIGVQTEIALRLENRTAAVVLTNFDSAQGFHPGDACAYLLDQLVEEGLLPQPPARGDG